MLNQNFKIEDSIYPENIINEAIIAFSEIANISYSSGTLSINAESDIEEIFNEFMNYVIALYNELS